MITLTVSGGTVSTSGVRPVTVTVTTDTSRAPVASPALTGTPTAPTQAALDNSHELATTAYADTAVGVEATRALAAEALLIPASQRRREWCRDSRCHHQDSGRSTTGFGGKQQWSLPDVTKAPYNVLPGVTADCGAGIDQAIIDANAAGGGEIDTTRRLHVGVTPDRQLLRDVLHALQRD